LYVAEVLLEFATPVSGADGTTYTARACGDAMADGMWQGWLEFIPVGRGEPVRSGRETTQPNCADTRYWATGLTPVFLEGSLKRALNPLRRPVAREHAPAVFDTPAPASRGASPANDSVLNPFSVYRKGEALLRSQLSAMSSWHLINIISAYGLSDAHPSVLQLKQPAALVELIVDAVRTDSRISR
jgi:hypothetical protein